ncbi:MAG: DUF3352 domain-containing protein [Marmoricola sp.]
MSDTESNPTPAPAPAPKTGLSNGVLAVVLVVILAILGGGGWLVYDKVIKSDDSSSALPATVLPASTLAVATVNTDPSLSEKVNLFNFIHKFPALKSKVTITAKDDPRKWILDQILKSAQCPSVNYDKDFASWLGNHFALGAVDAGASTPSPVAALETSNAGAATSTLNKLVACGKSKDFVFTVTNGYVVASDSKAHLDTIVAAAKAHPLSADAGYVRWTAKVDRDGMVTFYVAKAGVAEVAKLLSSQVNATIPDFQKSLGEFSGLAGSFSAVSDGLQLRVAVGSKTLAGNQSLLGDAIAKLPADTAFVAGFGMPKDAANSFTDGLLAGFGAKGGPAMTEAQSKAMIKRYTGLTLPGDLTTLLGRALVLSIGGNAPSDLTAVQNPLQLPIGLKIKGDPAKIRAVIAKIEAKLGGSLTQMGMATKVSGDDFVLATNQSYANAITTAGALSSDPAFAAAVPEASKAQGVFFLRIDSAWRTAIINLLDRMGMPNASEIADNTAGLSALGMASWTDGDAGMIDVKLTTK